MDHVFILEWLRQTSLLMNQKSEYLSDLESVTGDGIFERTMSVGFKEAYNAAAENGEKNIGKQLYKAGKAMLKVAPTYIGKIVATGFMEAGKAARGKVELEPIEFVTVLLGFEKGIKKAGRGREEDKALLEVFHSAVVTLKEAVQDNNSMEDALKKATIAAETKCNKEVVPTAAVIGTYMITTLNHAMKGILI